VQIISDFDLVDLLVTANEHGDRFAVGTEDKGLDDV